MDQTRSLSATNLATYQHLACDVYIHKAYHTPKGAPVSADKQPKQTKIEFQKGLDWENLVYSHLDGLGLLLRIPAIPIDGNTLLEHIYADERPHFFITGVTFWPPKEEFKTIFAQYNSRPLDFGLAKPDLLEIKIIDNKIVWKVIDAKSSRNVKTSHHIQIYFYTLCLTYIMHHPIFLASDLSAIWLPPHDHTTQDPSFEDIHAIPNSLLAASFHNVIFRNISGLLNSQFNDLEWHYNMRCRDCRYENECSLRTRQGGYLGNIPNIHADDAKTLRHLLLVSQKEESSRNEQPLSDIEELHNIITDPIRFQRLNELYPAIVKRTKDILIVRKRKRDQGIVSESPLLEASRTKTVQIIPRHNYTCPSQEDIAVIISVIDTKTLSSPKTDFYCIASHSLNANDTLPPPIFCSSADVTRQLSGLIRSISSTSSTAISGRTCQFYVWSWAEHAILQNHLLNSALKPSSDDNDSQTCIYALAGGASVVHAEYHPQMLQATLVNFVENGTYTECKILLERLGLPTDGSRQTLQKRIEEAIKTLRSEYETVDQEPSNRQLGRLPPIVVLKPEIERQLALPIAGFWDLREYVSTLLSEGQACPDDENIHLAYRSGDTSLLKGLLLQKNNIVYSVLQDFRNRINSVSRQGYLVNEGKTLVLRNTVICKEPHIRKLFLMQQFEVFAKLSMLWRSRADGCPESPLLRLRQSSVGHEHTFDVTHGNIHSSLQASDSIPGIFSHLLVKFSGGISDNIDTLLPEAFFNDIPLSNSIFPLAVSKTLDWEQQDDKVKKIVIMADVRRVISNQERDGHDTTTVVVLRTWGNDHLLQPGSTFRLSPRLIDFNTPKTLAALFQTDIKWDTAKVHHETGRKYDHRDIPFVQLITEPMSLRSVPMPTSDIYMDLESSIQNTFTNLSDQGDENARQLILKPSQRTATKSVLFNRLSVIWGPPGTGKTHTIVLSLLRLLEVEYRTGKPSCTVILMTAFTHAAIHVCHAKFTDLLNRYRTAGSLSRKWLEDINIEFVDRGNSHVKSNRKRIHVFMGTVYQLSKFVKRYAIGVNCVVIDEAGQLPLSSVSMVMQSLNNQGRIIIAGDSEQLAPIFTAKYPSVESDPIFGSIFDCLMYRFTKTPHGMVYRPLALSGSPQFEDSYSDRMVIQLTENFRLNPDLCEFVSTIYSTPFEPQNDRTMSLMQALTKLSNIERPSDIRADVFSSVNQFLTALSMVMTGIPQTWLAPPIVRPKIQKSDNNPDIHRVSLTLIRLKCLSSDASILRFDSRLKIEASVACSLVYILSCCSPFARIFVATPHRLQRECVKAMLSKPGMHGEDALDSAMKSLKIRDSSAVSKITVDTIERLQGSKADYVICLFSAVHTNTSEVDFLLERRRLNVAISRAKALCILITSDEVLEPPIEALSKESIAKGYAFLHAYEERAWSYHLQVQGDST